MFGYSVEIVKRNEQHLFRVLPKRWIVERTLAWLNWSRRLSKDYELRHASAESMIHIAFAHTCSYEDPLSLWTGSKSGSALYPDLGLNDCPRDLFNKLDSVRPIQCRLVDAKRNCAMQAAPKQKRQSFGIV
jgi:Transposase DDE domain